MIDVSRRSFLGFLAAPAIVRVASLMPVRALVETPYVLNGPPVYGASHILRSEDFRLIVEPILNEAFYPHYQARHPQLWQEIFHGSRET